MSAATRSAIETVKTAFPGANVTKPGAAYSFQITPQVAERILARCNTENRRVRKHHRAALARAIAEKQFLRNGETIKFSPGGVLLDGQHRLGAIVDAGVPVETLVAFGIEPKARLTIDRGKSRSYADDLQNDGEENPEYLATAVRSLADWLSGSTQSGRNIFSGSIADLNSVLEAHPGLRDSVAFYASRKDVRKIVPGRVGSLLHYLLGLKDPAARDAFFEDLASGAGLADGDPVLELRDRMIANNKSSSRLPHRMVVALVIKAWNYRRDPSARRAKLRFVAAGPKAEAFPEIAD